MRFAIVESSDGHRRRFVWDLHWALYDGWALRLLLGEAEKIYYNINEHTLENMSSFIQHIGDINNDKAKMFWMDQFSSLEGSHFPQPHLTSRHPQIDDEVTLVTKGLNWNHGDFTAATIIRAALSLAIAWNLNSTEAIFGATVIGRQADIAGMARMAGPAFSTLPIRVPIEWEASVNKLLESVQRQATDMVPFEQTSLNKIREVSDEAASACDFQMLLVIQSAIKRGDFRYRDEDGGIFVKGLVASKVAIVELGQRTGAYPMYVECKLDVASQVDLRICFDSGVVARSQMTRFINLLSTTLVHLSDVERGESLLKDVACYNSNHL